MMTQKRNKVNSLYGFRCDDINHIIVNRESIIKKILLKNHEEIYERDIVSTSLPIHFKACSIKLSLNDLATQITGLRHRIGGRVPTLNFTYLRHFEKFVARELEEYFEPLPYDTDVSVEYYLEHVNLPRHKKDKMLKEYRQYLANDRKVSVNDIKAHFKEEFYPTYKHIRGIFARHDTVKMLFGPVVHAMEQFVFKLPYFAKKIQGSKKAEKILSEFDLICQLIFGTDFESWESSVNEHIIRVVEIQAYKFLLKNIPEGKEFISDYSQIMCYNEIQSRDLKLSIKARRMSGEMTTSLGNGLINYMLLKYCLHLNNATGKVLIEGDDGLTVTNKDLDTSCFKELGFVCKLQKFTDVRESSFCGMIFSKPGHVIRDAFKALSKFGWCTRKYNNASFKTRMGLMRAKALSMVYENPHCPILRPFADRVCDLTRNYKAIFDTGNDTYHKNIFDKIKSFNDLPKADICKESRELYEHLFGIDINTQYFIESILSKIELYDDTSRLNMFFDKTLVEHYDDYVNHCYEDNYNREGNLSVGCGVISLPLIN